MVKMILTFCYFCACRFTEVAGGGVELWMYCFFFIGNGVKRAPFFQEGSFAQKYSLRIKKSNALFFLAAQ